MVESIEHIPSKRWSVTQFTLTESQISCILSHVWLVARTVEHLKYKHDRLRWI